MEFRNLVYLPKKGFRKTSNNVNLPHVYYMLQHAIISKVLPGSRGERETKEERALFVLKEFTGARIPTRG